MSPSAEQVLVRAVEHFDTLVVAVTLIAALLLKTSIVSVTDPRFGRGGSSYCSAV